MTETSKRIDKNLSWDPAPNPSSSFMNRNSERIPRSLLRDSSKNRANDFLVLEAKDQDAGENPTTGCRKIQQLQGSIFVPESDRGHHCRTGMPLH